MRRALVAVAALITLAACGSQTTDPAATPSAATVTPAGAPTQPAAPETEIYSAEPIQAAPTEVDPDDYAVEGRPAVAWVSPTGQISCRLATKSEESGCQSRSAPVPDGANCVNPTFTVDQLSKGFVLQNDTVTPLCFNQGVFSYENARELPYDQSITFDGATCTSRESGMTCTDSLGHGFVLSMQEARAF